MKLNVDWSDVANADVLRLHMPDAERICAEVLRFAETGRGPVQLVRPGDPTLFRLSIPGAGALVRLVPETRTLVVWRLYSRR